MLYLYFCGLQATLCILPPRKHLIQEAIEIRSMIGVLQVTDLMCNHVVDTNGRGAHQLGIQRDASVAVCASPSFWHGTQDHPWWRKTVLLAPSSPFIQTLGELFVGVLAHPRGEKHFDLGFAAVLRRHMKVTT